MKLTITRKLGSGFGIIILSVLINLYLANRTGRQYQKLETRIITVLNPSHDNLDQLADMVTTSKMLTKNWVFVDKIADTQDKLALAEIHTNRFPTIRDSLMTLAQHWSTEEYQQLQQVFTSIQDTLFSYQDYVMKQLSDVSSYDDVMVFMEASSMVDEYGDISVSTNRIIKNLLVLINSFEQQAKQAQNRITADFTGFQQLILFTNIVLILIVLISATYSHLSIVKPLQRIDLLIRNLATGNLSTKSDIRQNDEIGMIASSVNTLIDGLRLTTNFADEIGKDHLDAEFQTLSDDDVLGNSLLNMRASLQRADKEEQKRKGEDERRNWAAQGLAKFAEILRNNSDMETMTSEVLHQLVRYIDVNQGGIFVLNDNDFDHRYLEMRAFYAFDRKKFAEKQVEIGEGLIGACFQEGETIYMTEVPDDYVEITSGLGGANPKAILIIPLKINDEIFGVMELASFEEFPDYVREFVEKVSESIASTISSLKVNERTTNLLEQAKIQAQEMSEKEEELRQNMEELQATQEDWQRKESEYLSFNDAINEALPMIELSVDFEVTDVNKNVIEKLGIEKDKLLHHKYTDLLRSAKDENGKDYSLVIKSLQDGVIQETTDRLFIRDQEYICRQLTVPQRNNMGKIYKFLSVTLEIRTTD